MLVCCTVLLLKFGAYIDSIPRSFVMQEPSRLLLNFLDLFTDDSLPGSVLDLAAGDGHNGIALAIRGVSVICCDKSAAVLREAEENAVRSGVSIKTWQVDLENEGVDPLPENAYGGIIVFRYLHRPLIPGIRKAIRRGGILVYETFTLEQQRFGKPSNPNFLLKPGELNDWFKDWEVFHYFEGIMPDPSRAIAQIVCRKPNL